MRKKFLCRRLNFQIRAGSDSFGFPGRLLLKDGSFLAIFEPGIKSRQIPLKQMEKDFYKEYFRLEREHWWFLVRNKILGDRISALLPQEKPKILNVGVATGGTSDMMKHFGEVISVEYEEDCFEFVREILDTPVVQGSILALPFEDNTFDLVCAFDVVEHVDDDRLAVSELKRVCKPGGLVGVSVPAYNWMWSRHDEVNHHFRRYVLPVLRKLFTQAEDGKIIYTTYFNSLLFPPIAFFRLISKMIPDKLIRSGSGSDNAITPPNSLSGRLLYTVFSWERKLLKAGIRFPFGVSMSLFWRKNEL